MLNLIIKDFLVQKKTLLFAFLYSFFAIFVFQQLASGAYIAAGIAISFILIMTAVAVEDKTKSETMLNSLPISRTQIVLSRYLSSFVFIAFAILSYALAATILQTIHVMVQIYPINWVGTAVIFLMVGLMCSIYYPLVFKFGYINSRVFNVFIFLLFFFGPTFIMENLGKETTQKILDFLSGIPVWGISLSIMGSTLVILFISFLISVHVYKTREF